MNNLYRAIVLLFFTTSVSGQTLQDVLRYSTTNQNGTARYNAMGGAFGALGGDFGAIANNPAASSVFEITEFGITASSIKNINNTDYLNTNYVTDNRDLDFDQMGFVLVLKNTDDSSWSKISFAFNFQKTANFNNNFEAEGYNTNGIDEYFLNNAQGFALENFQLMDDENDSDLYGFLASEFGYSAQQGFLGYQSYVIEADEDTPINTSYYSNVAPGAGGFFHEYVTNRTGGIKKYTFNVGAVLNNKHHFGLNINSHNLEYRESTNFYESNYSDDSNISALRFNNELYTFGKGVSFQLGVISKLNNNIRLGLSYESPTYFSLLEETRQFIVTNTERNITIEPNVINEYPAYRFNTPSKYNGSIAYVFGKKGLLSLDYTQVNYDKSKFNEPNDTYLNNQNSLITSNLDSSGILKIGGEYRFGNYSIRGGFIEEGASLKTFDNSRTSKSIGAGINFGGSTLDLSIVSSERINQQQLFSTGLIDKFDLKKEVLTIGLTYSLKF